MSEKEESDSWKTVEKRSKAKWIVVDEDPCDSPGASGAVSGNSDTRSRENSLLSPMASTGDTRIRSRGERGKEWNARIANGRHFRMVRRLKQKMNAEEASQESAKQNAANPANDDE